MITVAAAVDPGAPNRRRLALVSLALLAMYSVCLFGRGAWTPDEPRELAIGARMSEPGASWAIPNLAGKPFCEKPPLYYWASAAAMRVFGRTPPAGRLANLGFAVLALLGCAALATRVAGVDAAVVSTAVLGTFALTIDIVSWARVDVALLPATAFALLGLHRGLTAATAAQRWRGYLLMHAALAAALLTKNVVGCVVPLATFATLVVWLGRWREAASAPFLIGFLVEAAAFGGWIAAVGVSAGGDRLLGSFFLENLVERFHGGDAYAGGHVRWFGKYLVELPLYLLPWSGLAACALWRAVPAARSAGTGAVTGYRFSLAAIVPGVLLLSLAATKREIYLAPIIPGVALLIGVWAGDARREARRHERIVAIATSVVVIVAAVACGPAIGLADRRYPTHFGSAEVALMRLLVTVAVALAAWTALAWSRPRDALARSFALFVLAVIAFGPLGFRLKNRTDDYAAVAALARRTADLHPLVLLHADETLIGALDFYQRLAVPSAPTLDALAPLLEDPGTRVMAESAGPRHEGTLADQACARFHLKAEDALALPLGRTYVVLSR